MHPVAKRVNQETGTIELTRMMGKIIGISSFRVLLTFSCEALVWVRFQVILKLLTYVPGCKEKSIVPYAAPEKPSSRCDQ